MLSICLHLLWESESARRPLYLRTRVSTFPKEREECRQAATLYDGFQPVPAVSPANASDPSRSLERTGSAFAAPEPSASPASHPKLPVLRPRRFGAAPNHRHYQRNPHRAGASPSRRGERNCPYSFETVPPMSALTLLQSKGVMSACPSAPPPAIRQQSTSQPTHHAADSQSLLEACCRSPQRGQRYPDVRQPAPQSATHSGWSEGGRCALPDASSPLPSSPASGSHRSSPGHRDSVRLRRPQTLRPKRKTAAPPRRPVRSAHSPELIIIRTLLLLLQAFEKIFRQ